MITLTKSGMFLIKYIAEVLGLLMNGIFAGLNSVGFPNVGVAIILFTIIIYLLMTPLQIQQQRFSKIQVIMQPEIKEIQDRYKNRKDQASMQKQQEEIQGVYSKYGVSMTGSCVQLLIQMPILFALYQVIYKIPGYISLIRAQIEGVATTSGFPEFISKFVENLDSAAVTRNFASGETANIIDTLYGLNSSQWTALLADKGGSAFADALNKTHTYLQKVTTFLGLSISDSPSAIFMEGWKSKAFLLMFAAVLFPILAYVTQVLNVKLMPAGAQNKNKDRKNETGADATMRSMNVMMPLMSAVFCFTLPVGVGIYWIAGAVVRSLQQLIINRHLDKEGLDDVIKKNQEKAAKKKEREKEKRGYDAQQITQGANRSARRLEIDKKMAANNGKDAADGRTFREGSIASRANLVKNYNEQHKKK